MKTLKHENNRRTRKEPCFNALVLSCSRDVKGQILVEILIALAVIFLSLTAAYFVVISANDLVLDKKISDQASFYADEAIGAVESIRDRGWQELVTGTHGLSFDGEHWNFSGTQDAIDSLTRSVIITDVATRTKRIEAKVSWTGFPNLARSISTVTHLSNWISEDLLSSATWLNPSTLSTGDLAPSGNQGEDIAIDNGHAYLATYHSNPTSSDLFVFDVSDPATPAGIANIDTGAGLHALSIKDGDTYLYGVSENDAAGFKVIDVSTASSPAAAATLNLPGTAANASIFVSGNFAYVGTKDDVGDEEFIVVDITAPTAPTATGSLEIGGDVNAIFVRENTAYLVTGNDTKELVIVDVSDPGGPQELGTYDMAGTEDAYSIFVETSARVFIGRLRINAGDEFLILNASNASSVTMYDSLDAGDDINDLVVVEYLAFLATSRSNGELRIVNISNLNNIATHSTFNYPQVAVGIDFQGEYVYVSTRSNDALRIVQGQ